MIHLTEELWQAAKKDVPLKNTLIFKTPERFWEYVFICQNTNREISSECLKLETDKEILTFRSLKGQMNLEETHSAPCRRKQCRCGNAMT